MIEGIGIDIIELERIHTIYRNNKRFMKRILTDKEVAVFNDLTTEQRKVEFLAGRFAAKEAFSKAAGTGLGKLSFQHIEVLPNENGKPIICVVGYEVNSIFLSISHSRDYVVAQVVIES